MGPRKHWSGKHVRKTLCWGDPLSLHHAMFEKARSGNESYRTMGSERQCSEHLAWKLCLRRTHIAYGTMGSESTCPKIWCPRGCKWWVVNLGSLFKEHRCDMQPPMNMGSGKHWRGHIILPWVQEMSPIAPWALVCNVQGMMFGSSVWRDLVSYSTMGFEK